VAMSAFVLAPLAVGHAASAEPAAACHGNAVSRSCLLAENVVRLESVNYDNPFGPTYAWQYVESWYHFRYTFYLYGDNACLDDWSCDHGIYESGFNSEYQVQGAHRLSHGGQTYSLGGTFTDGQCFPNESGGC
jgi:hypothetical protein